MARSKVKARLERLAAEREVLAHTRNVIQVFSYFPREAVERVARIAQRNLRECTKANSFGVARCYRIAGEWRGKGERTRQPGLGAG